VVTVILWNDIVQLKNQLPSGVDCIASMLKCLNFNES